MIKYLRVDTFAPAGLRLSLRFNKPQTFFEGNVNGLQEMIKNSPSWKMSRGLKRAIAWVPVKRTRAANMKAEKNKEEHLNMRTMRFFNAGNANRMWKQRKSAQCAMCPQNRDTRYASEKLPTFGGLASEFHFIVDLRTHRPMQNTCSGNMYIEKLLWSRGCLAWTDVFGQGNAISRHHYQFPLWCHVTSKKKLIIQRMDVHLILYFQLIFVRAFWSEWWTLQE